MYHLTRNTKTLCCMALAPILDTPHCVAAQLTHWRSDEKARLDAGHKEGGQRNAFQVPTT